MSSHPHIFGVMRYCVAYIPPGAVTPRLSRGEKDALQDHERLRPLAPSGPLSMRGGLTDAQVARRNTKNERERSVRTAYGSAVVLMILPGSRRALAARMARMVFTAFSMPGPSLIGSHRSSVIWQ